MRHLTFLRVYQPLEALPVRVHRLALTAAELSRADIEAEAAERLNRRLRPNTFALAPHANQPPIIRVIKHTGPDRTTRRYYHVNYLQRAAYESATMRRQYYDDALYNRLVPQQTLDTLQAIAEVQADAGLINRPTPNFHMALWNVPLAWLAAFGGRPETHEINAVNQSIVDGTTIIRRTRDVHAAIRRLGWVHHRLYHYGPEYGQHVYTQSVGKLRQWLTRHNITEGFQGVLELDYGALTRYAWPDRTSTLLEEGHTVLDRIDRYAQQLEEENHPLLQTVPPAMLKQAAETMADRYQAATKLWERIGAYEHAN